MGISAAQARLKRAEKRAKGLCAQCSTPCSTYKCERCKANHKEKDRLRANKKWQARKAAGLCHACGGQVTIGVRCDSCTVKHRNGAVAISREAKAKAVKLFNNVCHDCNLVTEFFAVYDFHHLDPSVKSFGVAKLFASKRKWELIAQELAKCIMLCSNCHRIRHAKEGTDVD